ncbi:MAG: hypothetical protein WC516_06460 [Patescibacteria group bacterium]|jgi:hypothetical protein
MKTLKATINHSEIEGERVTLILRKTPGGYTNYTWHSLYNGEEEELGTGGDSIESAVQACKVVWGADCWGLEWDKMSKKYY